MSHSAETRLNNSLQNDLRKILIKFLPEHTITWREANKSINPIKHAALTHYTISSLYIKFSNLHNHLSSSHKVPLIPFGLLRKSLLCKCTLPMHHSLYQFIFSSFFSSINHINNPSNHFTYYKQFHQHFLSKFLPLQYFVNNHINNLPPIFLFYFRSSTISNLPKTIQIFDGFSQLYTKHKINLFKQQINRP